MPRAWRKITEPETCKWCGSVLITVHNNSNVSAWAECEDCESSMELEFAEPYVYGLHGTILEAGGGRIWRGGEGKHRQSKFHTSDPG